MLLYRIAKKRFINDLSGKGAELVGGRWNRKGIPALYTSSSLALCMCEILVHTDKDIPPADMCFAEISVPAEAVADNFFTPESFDKSVRLGTDWLQCSSSLAIKVPSAVLPKGYTGDFNVIINPRHKDFSSVRIERVLPCQFDERLF